MKVIVAGAGIVGASIAYRLAQAGAEVTIIEAQRIGGGTSSVSYAWVNACEKLTSEAYFRLNMAGRAAHARLVDEFGTADWYPRPGVIQWQDSSAEAGGVDTTPQTEKFRQLVAWDYPAELIDGEALRKLEPEIAAEAYDGRPVVLYPQDGWCHAVLYAGRLVGAARHRHGAHVVMGRIAQLSLEAGRCDGVVLQDGTRIAADLVVNACGRWSNSILQAGADPLPLAPTAGLIAYTAPAGLQLTRGLRTPTVNLRPDGAGRLLLRAGDIDKLIDGEASAADQWQHAEELMRRARAVLPDLGPVPLEAARVAIRPMPADGYSIIGPCPNVEGLYQTVTHSGVTLAPFIGEAVTDEVMHGHTRPELAAFRPARFRPAA